MQDPSLRLYKYKHWRGVSVGVLVRGFYSVLKYHDQKQPVGERLYFI